MEVNVVNVGDGACTVVSDGWSARATVIDCGERWTDGAQAGASLASFLGGTGIANLESLIISHFDDDHWRGLVKLADHFPLPSTTPMPLDVYHSRLPEPVAALPATHFALISTAAGQPVNALELEKAWNSSGLFRVRRRLLSQGDVFSSAGERWLVHWPPSELAPGQLVATRNAIDQVWGLAADLRDHGHPALIDNLREAYSSIDSGIPDIDNLRQSGLRAGNYEDQWNDWIAGAPVDADDDSAGDHELISFVATMEFNHGIVPGLKRRYVAAARRVGRANNSLSLVVEALESGFIAFGDLEGPALKMLCESGRLANHYPLMLAPHHGTHRRWNDRLPHAALCVSQNGRGHQIRNQQHQEAHGGLSCTSTFEEGHIAVHLQ